MCGPSFFSLLVLAIAISAASAAAEDTTVPVSVPEASSASSHESAQSQSREAASAASTATSSSSGLSGGGGESSFESGDTLSGGSASEAEELGIGAAPSHSQSASTSDSSADVEETSSSSSSASSPHKKIPKSSSDSSASSSSNDNDDGGVSKTVPKIIHQTWKKNTPPEKWRIAQESWQRLHPEWEYHLWSDEDNEKFIRTKFPWFLPAFLAYPHPIERADSVRYFLLYTYGGLYVDLDMEATHEFGPILDACDSVCLATSANTGKFTNNLMASKRGEPYWELVFVEMAARANITSYITNEVEILENTGPRLMQHSALLWNEDPAHTHKVTGIDSKLVHPCGRCEPIPCTKPGAYVRLWEGNSWHDTISTLGMFFDCHLTAVLLSAFAVAVMGGVVCRYRRYNKEDDYTRRAMARSSSCQAWEMWLFGWNNPREQGYAVQKETEFDEDERFMKL